MPASAIGDYTFLKMTPQPIGPGTRIDVESRAGVPGVGLWDVGSAGREFQVETVIDVVSWAAAVALATAYKAAQAAGLLAIAYGGVNLPYSVQVLDVHATAEAAIGVGGTAGQAAALVRAQWRLIAV